MYNQTFLNEMSHSDLQRALTMHHDDETELQLESELLHRQHKDHRYTNMIQIYRSGTSSL